MEISESRFGKYILVCENEKTEGACCAHRNGVKLRETLKEMVKARGLNRKIRVSRTGCLDVCSEGANVLLMPDNIWFKRVEEKDLHAILDKAVSLLPKP